MAAISDYVGKVTSEHRDKPNLMATVAGIAAIGVDAIDGLWGIQEAFDLDEAVGAQLDAIGLWVGTTRNVNIAVNAYFSFDTAGVGFDQGIWYQVGDSTSSVTVLDDAHFRILIRAKIACNNWDGSLPAMQKILNMLLAYESCTASIAAPTISGYSGSNMAVVVTVNGNISVVTEALLTGGYVPLDPACVAVSYQFTNT